MIPRKLSTGERWKGSRAGSRQLRISTCICLALAVLINLNTLRVTSAAEVNEETDQETAASSDFGDWDHLVNPLTLEELADTRQRNGRKNWSSDRSRKIENPGYDMYSSSPQRTHGPNRRPPRPDFEPTNLSVPPLQPTIPSAPEEWALLADFVSAPGRPHTPSRSVPHRPPQPPSPPPEDFYENSPLKKLDLNRAINSGPPLHHSAPPVSGHVDTNDENSELLPLSEIPNYALLPNVPNRPRPQANNEEVPPLWKIYPLLPPATPPARHPVGLGKPPRRNQAADGHRNGYSISAASAYARSEPNLRLAHATAAPRPRTTAAPYRKRPNGERQPWGIKNTANEENTHPEHEEENTEDEDEYREIVSQHPEIPPPKFENGAKEVSESEDNVAPSPKLAPPPVEIVTIPKVLDLELETPRPLIAIEEMFNLREIETDRLPKTRPEPLHEEIPSTSTTTTTTKEATTTTTSTTPKPVTVPTTRATTESPKSSNNAPSGPVDIKELLRGAGSLSLSEILQQRGLSLADVIRGNNKHILSHLQKVATKTNDNDAKDTEVDQDTSSTRNTEEIASSTSTSPTTSSQKLSTEPPTPEPTSTTRPDLGQLVQEIKPVSLSELLQGKNLSLTEILNRNTGNTSENGAEISSNSKANLQRPATSPRPFKVPTPFKPGSQRTSTTPIPSTSSQSTKQENSAGEESETIEFKFPSFKDIESKQVPIPIRGSSTNPSTLDTPVRDLNDSSASTTSTTIKPSSTTKAKRPYQPAKSLGEYGLQAFMDDEDESGESTNDTQPVRRPTYGGQRPIATSRLTPNRPRKKFPSYVLHSNGFNAEDIDFEETNTTSPKPRLIEVLLRDHTFREIEDDGELPHSIKSAIIASGAIGGFFLLVFCGIFIVFRWKQKTSVRYRNRAALFNLSLAASQAAGASSAAGGSSDGSGDSVSPVLSRTTSIRNGYAKLPYKRSSLWGTLRRSVSVRQSVQSMPRGTRGPPS